MGPVSEPGSRWPRWLFVLAAGSLTLNALVIVALATALWTESGREWTAERVEVAPAARVEDVEADVDALCDALDSAYVLALGSSLEGPLLTLSSAC